MIKSAVVLLLCMLTGCQQKTISAKESTRFLGMLGGMDKVIVGPATEGAPGVQLFDHGHPTKICARFAHKQDAVMFDGFLNADGTVTPSATWIAKYCHYDLVPPTSKPVNQR